MAFLTLLKGVALPEKFLNTAEVAKYLDVNEKKVYALVKNSGLPATKVTGKWLFPRRLVDDWLASGTVSVPGPRTPSASVLLLAGSNDPVLESEVSTLSSSQGGPLVYFASIGSKAGLEALKAGSAHAAAAHMLDIASGEYNLPFLDRDTRKKVLAFPLATREQGIIVRKGNPFGIGSVKDIAIPGIRYINRRKGTGTRALFDFLLEETGLTGSQIVGYTKEARTHAEVALAVARGTADAGLGIRSAAKMFGLDFVTLRKERFDILTTEEASRTSAFQSFLEDLKSLRFKKLLREAGGYEELALVPFHG
jgi:excisionase family DNA binding protein